MPTSIIIDLIIAAVLALSIYLGWTKGMVRGLLTLAGMILALIAASQIADISSDLIVERVIRPATLAAIEQHADELTLESFDSIGQIEQVIDTIENDLVREKAKELLSTVNLPTGEITRDTVLRIGCELVDTVLRGAVRDILSAVIFILCFAVISLVLRPIIWTIEQAFKLPLLRELFAERHGYFSAEEWYERLDLGKTLKGMISAREADTIIRKLSFKSFEAEYKAVLIWLPETMNEEAANKLLKILEEPWEKTLFLLVSEEPSRLLSTILSRTQEVAVGRIDTEVLARVAEKEGVSDPLQARNMARLADGDLLELKHLITGESDAQRKENFDLFCQLMRLSYNDKHLELIGWAEEVAQLSREQQRGLLRDAARLLRESFMLHAGLK